MKACKLSIILLFLLLICGISTPVLALDFENKYIESSQTYNYYEWDSSENHYQSYSHQPQIDLVSPVGSVNSGFDGLSFMSFSSDDGFTTSIPEYDNELVYLYYGATKIGEGFFSLEQRYSGIIHTNTGFDWWLHITDFDSSLLPASSTARITWNKASGSLISGLGTVELYRNFVEQEFENPNLPYFVVKTSTNPAYAVQGRTQVAVTPYWENTIEIKDYDKTLSYLTLTRNNYISTLNITDSDNEVLFFSDTTDDFIQFPIMSDGLKFELISAYGKVFSESFFAEEEEEPTVSILASVKNIQDYSVIGDSTISFVSDTENITRTMPNGYDLFTLAKDTWYNVSASAEGFTPQLAYEPNLWTGSSAIDVWMIPTSEESNETVQMNWYVSERNSAGPGTLRLSNAVISINSKTLITDASGYASTILNRSGSISYTVKKDGYNTYSRAFTPNWDIYTFPTIDEHITLLKMGESIGDVTPVPTPDTRSSNQKAESAMNILFDNIEGIVQLAVVVLIISLISMIAGGGKKR